MFRIVFDTCRQLPTTVRGTVNHNAFDTYRQLVTAICNPAFHYCCRVYSSLTVSDIVFGYLRMLNWYIQVSGSVTNQNVAKKLFLNRERVIPSAQAPSVSKEEIFKNTFRATKMCFMV